MIRVSEKNPKLFKNDVNTRFLNKAYVNENRLWQA